MRGQWREASQGKIYSHDLDLLSVQMCPQKSPILLWAHKNSLNMTYGVSREHAQMTHRLLIPLEHALCRLLLSQSPSQCSSPLAPTGVTVRQMWPHMDT